MIVGGCFNTPFYGSLQRGGDGPAGFGAAVHPRHQFGDPGSQFHVVLPRPAVGNERLIGPWLAWDPKQSSSKKAQQGGGQRK